MVQNQCPFCNPETGRIWLETDFGVALPDGYPVAEGHTLIVPRRHVASLFDLTEDEVANVWKLVGLVRARLLTEHKPDAFTVGVNDGIAAGQTVMHAHVHVIPRRQGDVADPRGGIRWVVPTKAAYWNLGQR